MPEADLSDDPLVYRLDNLVASLRDRARYFRHREQFPLIVSQEIEVAAEALNAVMTSVRTQRSEEMRRLYRLERLYEAVDAVLQSEAIRPGHERDLLGVAMLGVKHG